MCLELSPHLNIFQVDHVRGLAKRQKDRLEKEIQELQAELQEIQDKHFDEVRIVIY